MNFKGIISFVLLVLGINLSFSIGVHKCEVENGVIDLSKGIQNKNEVIKLCGEWEFYPNQFIGIDEYKSNKNLKPVIKHIPSFWTKEEFKNNKKGTGFGTYHLLIIVNQDTKLHGLAFFDIFSSYRLFVDNELIAAVGVPAKTKKSYYPELRNVFKVFRSDNDSVHVFVQVSNFSHRLGGITKTPILGTYSAIRSIEKQLLMSDIFCISILFISAFMFFVLYIFMKREYAYLLFALFSFIAFISLFVINILHIFSFTHLSFNAVIKIQYITIYLMISTILLYIYYLYPLKSEKIRVFIICAINLLLVALSAVLPVYLLSWVIHYSKFIITLTIVYGVFYAINILKRKEEMSWIMIVGLSLITITSSVDLYMSTHYLQLANSVSRIGILLFILSQIFLLLKNFVDTQNQLEKLTKDLKHINNNLEKIVNSRTQKLKSQKLNLEDQRRQLKKIVKTKNKLFSIIGHDLRSPIGIANMYADTMLEDKTLKSKQHEMLKFISDSSSAALHLLNNLLMWGKSETGTVIYRPTYFDIQELFVESINQFKGAMEAKDLKFTINSENQIIFADRFMIFMVVNNVLSNAVKFSEPGKIIKATIHNIIIRKRKNVVIQIEDEGVGMSPELIETVLKTNEYISQRGTKNEKGSGLGLKICRDFIKQNNGKFNILSEKGKGTTIEIIIPVKIWD